MSIEYISIKDSKDRLNLPSSIKVNIAKFFAVIYTLLIIALTISGIFNITNKEGAGAYHMGLLVGLLAFCCISIYPHYLFLVISKKNSLVSKMTGIKFNLGTAILMLAIFTSVLISKSSVLSPVSVIVTLLVLAPYLFNVIAILSIPKN